MTSRPINGRKTAQEVLLEARLVTPENMALAKKSRKIRSAHPTNRCRKKWADKVDVLQVLSREWRTRAVDLAEMEIDPEVVRLLSEATTRKQLVVPFAKEDQVLLLAMANPRDFMVSEDIHIKTGLEVQRYLAMPEDIIRELDKVYGISGSGQGAELLKSVTDAIMPDVDGTLERMQEKTDVTEVDASAPEVEKIVNGIILSALQPKIVGYPH